MSTCWECQAEIRWARTTLGKSIPLDTEVALKAPEDLRGYFVETTKDGPVRAARENDSPPFYRSHFASCPNPRRFSGKSRDDLRQEELP